MDSYINCHSALLGVVWISEMYSGKTDWNFVTVFTQLKSATCMLFDEIVLCSKSTLQIAFLGKKRIVKAIKNNDFIQIS